MATAARLIALLEKAADASFPEAFAQSASDPETLAMLILAFPPVYWAVAPQSVRQAVGAAMGVTSAMIDGTQPPRRALAPVQLHALTYCGLDTAHLHPAVDLSTPQGLVYAAANGLTEALALAAPGLPVGTIVGALDLAASIPPGSLELLGLHGQPGDAVAALLTVLDERATALFDTACDSVGARRAALLCLHKFQDRTDLEVRDRLGAGAFGTVFAVADPSSAGGGEPERAVKITCVGDTLGDEVSVSQAVATGTHPGKRCVMRYTEWGSFTFDTEKDLWGTTKADTDDSDAVTTAFLVMPRATSDLTEYARSLRCTGLLRHFACILVGFEAMHQAGFVLCDLKPDNVVVFDAPPFRVPPELAAEAAKGWAVLSDLANCVRIGEAGCRGTYTFVAPPGRAWGLAPFSQTDRWGRASTTAMDYAQLGKTIIAVFADVPSAQMRAGLVDLPSDTAMLAALDRGRELLGTRMRCPGAPAAVELVRWAVGAIRGCFDPQAGQSPCHPPFPPVLRAEMDVVRRICDAAGDAFFAESEDEAASGGRSPSPAARRERSPPAGGNPKRGRNEDW